MTAETTSTPTAQLLAILRRRLWIIIACTLVTGIAAFVVSVSKTSEYEASAKLLIIKSPQVLLGDGSTSNPEGESDFDPATSKSLATLRVVAQQASEALGGRVTADEIRDQVAVESTAESGLVTVTAQDSDPRLAAGIATAFAKSFANYLKRTNQSSYDDAAALVTDRLASLRRAGITSSAEVTRLRSRLDDLRSSAALQNGGVKLAENAPVPDSAVTPKPARDLAVGLLAGLVIGLALAFAIDSFDRRVRTTQEFEDIFEQPILGEIPRSEAIRRQNGRPDALPSRDAEAFRLIRASLRYLQGSANAKSIIVTSSTSGEGKSTVAWNLALTAAISQTRVLLIEADLRRPQIVRRYLKNGPELGLSDVLAGQAKLESVIVDYADVMRGVDLGPEFGLFDILLAGHMPPNPTQLLESPAMEKLLARMASQYDLVIIDAPPPSLVADALSLFPLVDGVVVVGRLGYSDRRLLRQLSTRLQSLGTRTLGMVINGSEANGSSDYYS